MVIRCNVDGARMTITERISGMTLGKIEAMQAEDEGRAVRDDA